MSGASQMPVSGTSGLHPVQRFRFNPSDIQDNSERAEGSILLFVYLVPVFCMSPMGGVSA